MQTYRVNDEEVALLVAFRLLTTRQRAMILQGVIGVTSAPQARVSLISQNIRPLHPATPEIPIPVPSHLKLVG